ncbi:MAG TPA: hypothetical protein VNM90_17170 [Haliangium sp.]|nr:hypothetical protein [Haliangium sp.]
MDRYIDYREVSQYGRFFVDRMVELVGASPLVDVEAVRQLVLGAVVAVETGMLGTGTQQSSLRTERDGSETSAEALADLLRRYYLYLQSLPPQVSFDLAAFFPAGKIKPLSSLKAEDLLSRADDAMRGFAMPANALLPNAVTWQGEIAVARLNLAGAIGGKLDAAHGASGATESLAQARERFLHVYLKVAKPLIRGLLAQLGREHELRKFFRDMQVQESRAPGQPREEPGDLPDDLPDGGAPEGVDVGAHAGPGAGNDVAP